MSENIEGKNIEGQKTRIKNNRRICCVVGCNNREGTDSLTFYRFPERNQDQKKKWITAVKRINPDGSPWFPNKSSRICSDHFLGGKKSFAQNDPSYVPTIFPTNHKRESTFQDKERFERAAKRMKNSELVNNQSKPNSEEKFVEASTQTKEQLSCGATNTIFESISVTSTEASTMCCFPTVVEKSAQTDIYTGHKPTTDQSTSTDSAPGFLLHNLKTGKWFRP
jgi:hypothetical protein